MRGDLRPAEHVDHEQIHRAPQPGRQLHHDLAGVAVADPDGGAPREGQSLPYQRHEIRLELDDLLARPGPGGLDVAGQRQGAGAEVQSRHGALGEQIDGVADAVHGLEGEVGRVVEVDVRLRRPVDDQRVGAGAVAVLVDARETRADRDLGGGFVVLCGHGVNPGTGYTESGTEGQRQGLPGVSAAT